MNAVPAMTTEEILEKLVGFPSVVGSPNGEIASWIADYCRRHGAEVHVLPGPEGDRANILATVGPRDRAGYILSGHTDVVPAGEPEWTGNPFALRSDATMLYGRGTTDMKGFLACTLAALPSLAAMSLARPIHLAFSYDEEAGARGVPHLISQLPALCEKPSGAIIGEPSRMQAVRAHKGKVAARLEVIGKPGHSSRPELGLNAIHAMAEIILQAVAHGRTLAEGPFDKNFEPPYSSLQIGVISGWQAVNVIPDRCFADIELRAVSGISPGLQLDPVRKALETLRERGFSVGWQQLSAYPALSLPQDAPLVGLVEELTGNASLAAVSYGTEAGLFQEAGIDSIICGPGNIAQAHRPDEFIERAQLRACSDMIDRLALRLCA